MTKTISIKDFRANLAAIAVQVEKGRNFTVIRRSKPSFLIVPIGTDIAEEGEWETVIDFTENGKTKGMQITDVLSSIKKITQKK